MNTECMFVLKENASVDNYKKIDAFIKGTRSELDVWGLAKAIESVKCQHNYDDAHSTDNCDFILNEGELFIWVMGKLHWMDKEELLSECANAEEKELLKSLEIGFPNGFPRDFYEDLEQWLGEE